MSWSPADNGEFLRALHDLWPSKKLSPREDDEYLEAVKHYPLVVALQALKRCKHEEEFPRRPTIRRVVEKCGEISSAKGLRSGSPKSALIAKLVEEHSGKIWRGGKARMQICGSGFHLVDKKPGDWCLPWGDCTESDLRQVVADLERGTPQESEAPF